MLLKQKEIRSYLLIFVNKKGIMKKILQTISLVLISYYSVFSQSVKEKFEESKEYANSIELAQTGKNEIKFNLLTSVIGYPEITYERILATNMSIGSVAAFSFNDRTNQFQDYLLGFYRIYFGKKIANGPFIESNLGITHNKDTENYIYYDYAPCAVCDFIYYPPYEQKKTTINMGIGFALGYKFLTKNGLQGEIFGGLGRNSGNAIKEMYPRVGVSIGKRFGK